MLGREVPLHCLYMFFCMCSPPRRSTLFPYTTLFRSQPVLNIDCEFKDNEKAMNRQIRADAAEMLNTLGFRDIVDFDNDQDRKSTRLNSSHVAISYAVFCLKKKKTHGILLSDKHAYYN